MDLCWSLSLTILREPVEIFIFSPGCAHFYPVPEKLNVAMKSLNYASDTRQPGERYLQFNLMRSLRASRRICGHYSHKTMELQSRTTKIWATSVCTQIILKICAMSGNVADKARSFCQRCCYQTKHPDLWLFKCLLTKPNNCFCMHSLESLISELWSPS